MSGSQNCFVSINIQERDFELLRDLFECRIMTAGHITVLHFGGKREYAKKRLQKLKGAGLISERRRRVNEPAVLFLSRKAFNLLSSEGHLSGYPPLGGNSFESRASVSELTLRHELEIMDVKAAYHDAIKKSDRFTIAEFSTWPLLYQFETTCQGQSRNILVKPDGFVRIHEKEADGGLSERTCFLEVDRSTEKLDTLITRATCYLEYYRSGGFAVRSGATRADFREYPFRVLIVLKSAERRNNVAEQLAQNNPPILTQVWLTTMAEATSDPLGAIWIQPCDYRDVLRGATFLRERPANGFLYRRQPEREFFVESKIKKLKLLE